MNTVEEAYQNLGQYVLAFIGDRPWDAAGCRMSVYGKMASGYQWLTWQGQKDDKGGFEGHTDSIWKGLEAATFLRDDLLRNQGQRIWALEFRLAPDGTFKIEYDYNQPDDYEETDALVGDDDSLPSNP